MLDHIFIRRKIKLIQEDLKHLEEFQNLTFDEAARDWMKWNALEWALAKIIGRAIDINRHLIAELGGKDITPPKDYTETFLLLKQLNILPGDFVSQIAPSAGFRNRIIHEYNDIKKDLIYSTVGEAVEQYLEYCAYILKFVESSEKGQDKFSSGFGTAGIILLIAGIFVIIGGGFFGYQYLKLQKIREGVKPPSTETKAQLSYSTETQSQTDKIYTRDWKTYNFNL